jgi:hypothetical protein
MNIPCRLVSGVTTLPNTGIFFLTERNALYNADNSAECNWKLLQQQNNRRAPARIKT